jgi:hypothetical protein
MSEFQNRVAPWMQECFGAEISSDKVERNHRFIEEALELVQACGCSRADALRLVDYVYGRPVGVPEQEVGGVMVTLAALCLANGMDMHLAGDVELDRVWTKVEAIRAKQASKPKGALPQDIGWQIGAVAIRGCRRAGGAITDYPTPGWVRGIWGIDFRTVWGVDPHPVYCVTHMPSGINVAALYGCLAEVQAFIDALDEVGDWSSIGGDLVMRSGRVRAPANGAFDSAFHQTLARFQITMLSTDHAIAPFTVDAAFMGEIQ